MKKLKIFSLILSILICFTCISCSADSNGINYTVTKKGTPVKVDALSFDNIGGDDVMPICGFFGPYYSHTDVTNCNNLPDYFSDDIFKKITDLGINTIVYYDNPTDFATDKYLEMGDKYNMAIFVSDPYVADFIGANNPNNPYGTDFDYDYLKDKVAEWNKHKSFAGIRLRDEPMTYMFGAMKEVREAFETFNLKNKYCYVNAISFGYDGSDVYTGWKEYMSSEDYLNGVFGATNAKMLSYSNYPFTVNTPDSNLVSYFNTLSVAETFSKKYGAAKWRVMPAGGYFSDGGVWQAVGEPFPTEGEFLFDANISLAYGAKGIQFFPMLQPEWFGRGENNTYDNNRNGVIAINGEYTRWGYYTKKLTTQVQAIDPVLLHSTVQAIVLNGDYTKEIVATDDRKTELKDSFRELEKVSGGDALIGCFDYLGGTALYAVNFSRTEKNNITLNFNGNYGYEVTQRGQLAEVSGNKITLTLEAGEGALIVLK